MKQKMKVRKALDIYETIEKATLKIKAGYSAFFIDVDCGSIGLELDTSMDLMTPVLVENWKSVSEKTDFYVRNIFTKSKFYAKIRCSRHTDEDVIRALISIVVAKCMVVSLDRFSVMPDLEEVFPLVIALMDNMPTTYYSFSSLVARYMEEEFNKFKYILSDKTQKKMLIRNMALMMDQMTKHARIIMSVDATDFYGKDNPDVFCRDKFYQMLLLITYSRELEGQKKKIEKTLFEHNTVAWLDTKYSSAYYAIRDVLNGKEI